MKTQWMFALMITLFGWTFSHAQDNIQYGIGGGIGFSNFNYSAFDDLPIFNHDPIMAYSLNVYIGIRPSEKFGVSFEPGYSRRGGKVGLLPGTIPVTATWKMEYIQLPVMLDFYVTDRISVSAGPEFSYRVDSNADYLGLIAGNLDRKFSAGVLAGINISLHDNIDFGLRYHRAFTPVATMDLPGIGEIIQPKLSMHNQYFQLVARYTLK